jgi:hypothetical protein
MPFDPDNPPNSVWVILFALALASGVGLIALIS